MGRFTGELRIWLDDAKAPDDKDYFPEEERYTHWFRTAEECIAWLKTGMVAKISLDNDLGQGLTGYDVAKYIERAAEGNLISRIKWTVHSMNPDAIIKITMALNNADKYWTEHEKEE